MKNETTADQYVFVEQHSTSYNAAAWIQGFGGYLINENREPGLNLPQKLWNIISSLCHICRQMVSTIP